VTPDQRAVLAALADVLVPAAEGMPAASEVRVHERWIDRALAARPDLEDELLATLEAAAGREPAAEVERLRTREPARFEALSLLVTGAYYLHPRVRKLIGYPGQRRNPAYPDEAEWYLRDGLLDPVIGRGPIYRPTPGG
jgi:hypothetical protein